MKNDRYDWPFLMTIITGGYLGWLAVVILFTIKHYSAFLVYRTQTKNNLVVTISGILGILLSIYLYLQHSPPFYFIYAFFPGAFWIWVFRHGQLISLIFEKMGYSWMSPVLVSSLAMEGLVYIILSLCRSPVSNSFLRYLCRYSVISIGQCSQLDSYFLAYGLSPPHVPRQ